MIGKMYDGLCWYCLYQRNTRIDFYFRPSNSLDLFKADYEFSSNAFKRFTQLGKRPFLVYTWHGQICQIYGYVTYGIRGEVVAFEPIWDQNDPTDFVLELKTIFFSKITGTI